MNILRAVHQQVHEKAIFKRRIEVLAHALAGFLPSNASVLDVGCGSGTLAKAIMQLRPDVVIEGIDVLVRPNTDIAVSEFDGKTIPKPDGHYDCVLFVDVLHHTDDPTALMTEARRVAKQGVVIKDHFCDDLIANLTLCIMDWVGNAAHGVRLPYNYLSKAEWQSSWSKLNLKPERLMNQLGLYPVPFTWLFDRKLHFIVRLS
jgi:2-polyprenyl-3-methyl-5-hydroxy-6-metoxy-1,4-benzoquinol methylase